MNESDLVRIVIAASEAVRLEELGGALADLGRVLGSSGVLLYRYDLSGAPEWIAGDLVPAAPLYPRDLFEGDPIHARKRQLAPRVQIVHATQLVLPEEHRASVAYADFYRPHALEHLLCTWLTPTPYGDPGMVGLLLARSPRSGDFDERELRLLSAALPAFTAAAARSARVDAAERARVAVEAVLASAIEQAQLAFDRRGALLWASPRAEQLIGAALANGGRELPGALVAEVRRLGGLASAAGHEGAGGALRFELALVVGERRVNASLALSRSTGGEPIVICALEAASEDAALDQEVARRYGLTPAEERVLALLALGLGNEAIGRRLFVSIETVRTHVKRIFGKLGVSSRAQAAQLAREPPASGLRRAEGLASAGPPALPIRAIRAG